MGLNDFNGNVDADYLRESAKILQNLKEYSYKTMQLKEESIVLDIGCGPGIDVNNISKLISDRGKIFGLDSDEKMILESKKSFQAFNIEFIRSDVNHLPFPDNYFDAVRAERLFQVLGREYDSICVLDEIIRVTKSDGIITLVDTDWGTASVDCSCNELTSKLLLFFSENCRPNGFAGRQFYSLFRKKFLNISEIRSWPVLTFDYNQTPLEWLTDEAIKSKRFKEQEITDWKNELLKKNSANEFLFSVNMIIIAGKKI